MIANYDGWKSLISVSGVTMNAPVVLKSEKFQTVTGLYGVSSSKELYARLFEIDIKLYLFIAIYL